MRCCRKSPAGSSGLLRKDDTLARLGGDEFVLARSRDLHVRRMRRSSRGKVLSHVAQPVQLSGLDVHVSAERRHRAVSG